ncbi:unnamed protein product [Lampetra fluviatilis]
MVLAGKEDLDVTGRQAANAGEEDLDVTGCQAANAGEEDLDVTGRQAANAGEEDLDVTGRQAPNTGTGWKPSRLKWTATSQEKRRECCTGTSSVAPNSVEGQGDKKEGGRMRRERLG